MLINTSTLQSVTRTVRGLFLDQLMGAASLIGHLAMPAKTTTGEVVLGWLGNIPSMKPFVKELEKQTLAVSDWTVRTQEYAMGYEIPMLAIKRDQLGIYNPIFSAAGQRAGQHRDYMLAQRMLNGFTEKDYTGKNFFDTDKIFVKGSAAKFSNKSTKKLTLAYFRDARKMLRSIKDPNGYPLHPNPKFLLVVGPELEADANDIIKADKLANGASNTEFNAAAIEVWGFIPDGKWFLFITNSPLRPFVDVDEITLDLYARQDPSSEGVFNRNSYDYKAYSVNKVDFGLPQLAFGSTGADA